MAPDGSQAVVWQTAINPVVALELLASGTWSGSGVLGPEAFDAVPFLDLLSEYGSPWGMREAADLSHGAGRSRLARCVLLVRYGAGLAACSVLRAQVDRGGVGVEDRPWTVEASDRLARPREQAEDIHAPADGDGRLDLVGHLPRSAPVAHRW
jgi:hypothetical protein